MAGGWLSSYGGSSPDGVSPGSVLEGCFTPGSVPGGSSSTLPPRSPTALSILAPH